jgi:hypothetical protein
VNAAKRLEPVDFMELQLLAADYWARADGDLDRKLEDLFTPDAVLVLGTLHLSGREAIERFFLERDAKQLQSQRITRHIACNHRVSLVDENHALVRSTVLVYVGTGSPPLESGAPSGIADFEDLCVRARSRPWLFARRVGRTIFVGPGAASFAR